MTEETPHVEGTSAPAEGHVEPAALADGGTAVIETPAEPKKGFFRHSREAADKKIAELTKKMEGKEGDELAKLEKEAAKVEERVGKLNKGKIGLVAGAAVVLAAVLAGVGSQPGEKAQKVRDEQASAQQKDASPAVA